MSLQQLILLAVGSLAGRGLAGIQASQSSLTCVDETPAPGSRVAEDAGWRAEAVECQAGEHGPHLTGNRLTGVFALIFVFVC